MSSLETGELREGANRVADLLRVDNIRYFLWQPALSIFSFA
ncbi:hypothetical protein DR73_986 [Enterobacteriaceae bacterium ATCC 29904]|nr:hypothetical protein DR73_986 [Enterobacteriaceae bacterium ATCC 29904]